YDVDHIKQPLKETFTIYIVMERVECTLDDFIKKNKSYFDDISSVNLIISNLLSVLSFLHDNNAFHRDIKPQNILLDRDNCWKLSELQLAKTESIKHTL